MVSRILGIVSLSVKRTKNSREEKKMQPPRHKDTKKRRVRTLRDNYPIR